jgi:hypothetical protein
MRRFVQVLIFSSVLLSACARFGAGGGVSDPSDGKSDDPVSETPGPLPSGGDGSHREQPDATVFDEHPVAVDHFTIGSDGRTVVVYWWGGNTACFGLKSVTVRDVDGRPQVTVLEGTREAARDQACTMEALLKSAVVDLDEPILVDAANPDPQPGAAAIVDGAQRVKPTDGVKDPRPHAVSGYALSADGLALSIYYVGGVPDCYALASATARPQAGSPAMTVRVMEGWIAADGVACDDIGVSKVVVLKVDQPLMTVTAPQT